MSGVFFDESKKFALTESEKSNMILIFNWLLGIGIDKRQNKGLLLTGDFGTGKSVIAKGIISFIKDWYSIENNPLGICVPIYVLSQEMASYYRSDDEVSINRLKTTHFLSIDDIGYEPIKVNHYGTEVRPFEEILMARYDNRLPIMLTSNLSIAQIGAKYGMHISDRLREMVIVVEFKGKSKR
jgi:DNA replication protein DnaC